jgi:hypothetical protein
MRLHFKGPGTRLLGGSSCLLATMILVAGCAQPTLVHTRAELARSLGRKVAVEGVYEVGETGERVRSGDIDVALDMPQDILGFGRPPLSNGSFVRASGVVERGAMSLGVFIDADTLAAGRDQSISPGFVLRDAKVDKLKSPPAPSEPPRAR